MNDLGSLLLGLGLVSGLIALVVFLVLREFWCWYWKQSEQVAVLKEIAASLQRLEERGRPAAPRPATALPPAAWVPPASPVAIPASMRRPAPTP